MQNLLENTALKQMSESMCMNEWMDGHAQKQALVVQAALPLEGGRQCMIWPEHGGLSAHGEDFVIDPYSQGALYSQAEVSCSSITSTALSPTAGF